MQVKAIAWIVKYMVKKKKKCFLNYLESYVFYLIRSIILKIKKGTTKKTKMGTKLAPSRRDKSKEMYAQPILL